ncbi:hypothetical protein thalar_01431 [Litoreibacter arenae DSM 19593]|uniref:Uncharacterized protein n=1 Tax=Litoreibacter arenae DSM 19593 TaxID=1123360 RepID=S9RPY3_9RHOB|nr:hypothetical protein thalar_01431 [Litoreibacter arenae DSM 19593]
MAVLRAMVISQVIGLIPFLEYLSAYRQTFMNVSCKTSSALALLFNTRSATPKSFALVASYRFENAVRSPKATLEIMCSMSEVVVISRGSVVRAPSKDGGGVIGVQYDTT